MFAFSSMEEILEAIAKINGDYARQSNAAAEIALEYFRAETVLAKLLQQAGVSLPRVAAGSQFSESRIRSRRFLVVNADDFGLTNGVNRGIIEAHERGIVTSASLMVRHPAAAPAAEYARTYPELSVGLHFDAQEWRYRDRQWEPVYHLIDTADAGSVCQEFERQLAVFQRLLGSAPTHLDSHQHIHLAEPARSILLEYAEQMGVPLRSCTPSISYHGSFYGQTDEGESLPAGISTEAFSACSQTLGTRLDGGGLPSGVCGWIGLGVFRRTRRRDSGLMQCGSSDRTRSQRPETAIVPRLRRTVKTARTANLLNAELLSGEVKIKAALRHQLIVIAHLGDHSLFQNNNRIRFTNRAQAVRDHNRCAACINRARLSWIARSDSVSSALVASSKIKMDGLL